MKEEFSTKGQRWFSEERMLFSTEYAGKFGLPYAKIRVLIYILYSLQKLTQK